MPTLFIYLPGRGCCRRKIADAEAAGLYDLKMENAAIIRKAARDLMVQQHSLYMFGFEYVEYYQMVRDLIEEYRLLFIEWVAGFDKNSCEYGISTSDKYLLKFQLPINSILHFKYICLNHTCFHNLNAIC